MRPWLRTRVPEAVRLEDASGRLLVALNRDTGVLSISDQMPKMDFTAVYEIPVTNYGAYPASSVGIGVAMSFSLTEAEEALTADMGLRKSMLAPQETMRHRIDIQGQDCVRFFAGESEPFYIACFLVYADKEDRLWKVEAVYELTKAKVAVTYEDSPRPFSARSNQTGDNSTPS